MSIDLKKLANKLDEALINETSETLNKFLTDKRMSNNKQSSTQKGWLILPLLMFGKCADGSYEILIGWLIKSYTIKFNKNEQQ